MTHEPAAKPIVLIGFPGSGKSTVGRLVAARIGRRFLDLDEVIVAEAGRPIADIFRADGEPAFRQLERAALGRMLGQGDLVLATGGGAACREDNLADMLARAHVVSLGTSAEEAIRRTGARSGRPLFDNAADPLAAARALMAARAPFYRRAHFVIETEGKTPEQVAGEIVAAVLKEKET